MTRRSLFGVLASAAAAFALDPERALWVPGAKTISIPEPVQIPRYFPFVSGAALRAFCETQANEMDRHMLDYIQSIARDGKLPKIGDTIQIRLPQRFNPDADFRILLEPRASFTRTA